MCDKIDEITPDDIRRVAHRVFGPDGTKPATVIAMGRDDVGDWRGVLRKVTKSRRILIEGRRLWLTGGREWLKLAGARTILSPLDMVSTVRNGWTSKDLRYISEDDH